MADIFEVVNLLREAIIALETELGINPKKIYSNVRARLDILENRINNPSTPSPSTDNPFFIGESGQTISAGAGEPASSEASGSLYLRSDGENNEKVYVMYRTNWIPLSYIEHYKLTGTGAAGAAITLLDDGSSAITLSNSQSCCATVKLLIGTTSGTITQAYFEYKYLISQDSGGTLTLNQVDTISLDNSTGWTITINNTANTFNIIVDASGSDDRIAKCVVELQKISNEP